MTVEYVDEQHQVEHLKKLFKEYGLPILSGLVLAIIMLLGWQYYQAHKTHIAQQASSQYMQVLNAVQADKPDRARNQAQALMKQYPSTQYAVLAAMFIAHYQIQEQHFDQAQHKIQWAINNTDMPMLKSMAHIRLARLAMQQGDDKKALKQLKLVKTDAYQGLAEQVKGDIKANNQHYAQAYKAYKQAQQSVGNQAYNRLLPMKIANLPVSASPKHNQSKNG